MGEVNMDDYLLKTEVIKTKKAKLQGELELWQLLRIILGIVGVIAIIISIRTLYMIAQDVIDGIHYEIGPWGIAGAFLSGWSWIAAAVIQQLHIVPLQDKIKRKTY